MAELDELTGLAAAVLEATGWTGERRNPAKDWATTWRRADAHAWIQGEGPSVQVEFTLGHRDVDEEWPDPDSYIDELYEAATTQLPGLVVHLEAGAPGVRLQHDATDAPVQLVVVVRDDSTEAQDDGGERL
ncbi:hypothetical protein ACFUAC_15745 [Streptomyces sp. NPDC057148]|uniref:hypothetical protein n=1 Tax=unclassified Streptomyces TaxID=2593676 RepID=UPI003643EC44